MKFGAFGALGTHMIWLALAAAAGASTDGAPSSGKSPPPRRRVCRSDPFVQHAPPAQLCERKPPFGMRQVCAERGMRDVFRAARDPDVCAYRSCAVVGASANLIGATLGAKIDAHDAVFRINGAPDGDRVSPRATGVLRGRDAWRADLGRRTTWRVMNVEVYSNYKYYPRRYLAPPAGAGLAADMSAAPRLPHVAFYCIIPAVGRCSARTLRTTLDPALRAGAHMLNPLLLYRYQKAFFKGKRQLAPSTGMAAIALALSLCNETTLFGFSNGKCEGLCYHYYENCYGHERAQADFQLQRDVLAVAGGVPMHNFSAQVEALRELVARGRLRAEWGTCAEGEAANPGRGSREDGPRRPRRRGRRRL